MDDTKLRHANTAIGMVEQACRKPRPEITCPECGEQDIGYEPPYPAERDTNTSAWGGGYLCPACGWKREGVTR